MKKVINIIAWVDTIVILGALMWTLSLFPSYDTLERGWKLGVDAMSGWLYMNWGWTTPAVLFIGVLALVLTINIMRGAESKMS